MTAHNYTNYQQIQLKVAQNKLLSWNFKIDGFDISLGQLDGCTPSMYLDSFPPIRFKGLKCCQTKWMCLSLPKRHGPIKACKSCELIPSFIKHYLISLTFWLAIVNLGLNGSKLGWILLLTLLGYVRLDNLCCWIHTCGSCYWELFFMPLSNSWLPPQYSPLNTHHYECFVSIHHAQDIVWFILISLWVLSQLFFLFKGAIHKLIGASSICFGMLGMPQ